MTVVDLYALPNVELRDAAISAEAYLLMISATAYGFITGAPEIDVARCDEAIDAARGRGLTWTEDELDARIIWLVAGHAQEARDNVTL